MINIQQKAQVPNILKKLHCNQNYKFKQTILFEQNVDCNNHLKYIVAFI
jgi:hypothetical protein